MVRLLIVDAHAPTREHLLERLHADGHAPVGCANAAEGFEKLAEEAFVAVLLALDLPPLDGEHLAKKLRRGDIGIPVLIYDCGHRGTPKGVQAILDLGANAYLPDPTDHKALTGRLDPLLQKAARDEEKTREDAGSPLASTLTSARTLDEGTLELGALPRMLLAARAAGRNGAIILKDETSERTIYLLGGVPVGYRSSIRRENLGPWLVDRGRIDETTYQSSLEVMAREQLSQSASLVAVGALEGGEPIYALLIEHATDNILRAFGVRRGRFKVVDSEALAAEVPALEIASLPLIRQAASQTYPVRFFHDRLAERMDQFPYRTESFGIELNAMALSAKELTWAMKITGDVATRDLVEQARGEMKAALLLLWFFDRVGVVSYAEERHESEDTGTYQAPVKTDRKKKPIDANLRLDLTEEALSIVTASYFGALGLDITADVDSVEEAYHELATRFHPESYPENDVSDVEDLFQTVQDKVGAAYRVLSIPEKKKAYLGYLLSRQEVKHRRGPITVDAEIELRRGINAMAAEDWRSAQLAFEAAAALNPREPEYQCYLAFASYKAATGPTEARAKQPRRVLQKALGIDPEMEHALVLLGIIEQECGDTKSARRHFLDALKANAHSVTAKAALHRLDRVSSSS